MNPQSISIRILVVSCTALLLFAPRVQSANITWGTPQQITGDTDVSTTGTFVGAANMGAAGVPSTTVNGVTFQSFPTTSGNGSSGNFMATGSGSVSETNTNGGSANPPFASLTAAYQALLMSYTAPFAGTLTLTISGLILGTQYQFQWWANNSSFPGNNITATAGNSVGLHDNTSGDNGGLGQWVIGSFTADAATQTITFRGDGDGGVLNGFQLRQLPKQTPGVPDNGSTFVLLGCALAGLAIVRRHVRTPA